MWRARFRSAGAFSEAMLEGLHWKGSLPARDLSASAENIADLNDRRGRKRYAIPRLMAIKVPTCVHIGKGRELYNDEVNGSLLSLMVCTSQSAEWKRPSG